MDWIFFGFVCALSEAFKDIFSKKLSSSIDSYNLTWGFFVVTTILLLPLFYFYDRSCLNYTFISCLFSHGILFLLSVFLYMKAISISEISLVVPLVMFTPIFMMITSPLIINEYPSLTGVLGVFLIILGSYLLKLNDMQGDYLRPFKLLYRDRGAKLMFLVAFIWSLTSIIDKIAIKNINPYFWAAADYSFISIVITLWFAISKKLDFASVKQNLKSLCVIGLFNYVQVVSYVLAMASGLAIYVLSIKRTSVLYVVIFGSLIFKEGGLKGRVVGVLIMLIGVVTILSSK